MFLISGGDGSVLRPISKWIPPATMHKWRIPVWAYNLVTRGLDPHHRLYGYESLVRENSLLQETSEVCDIRGAIVHRP